MTTLQIRVDPRALSRAVIGPRTHPAKVLLVDGHDDTRELYGLWLGDHGFAVTAVATAEEALDRIRDDAPDVIVLEIMIAGGGPHLVRDVRATAQGRAALLIVLTTQGSASTRATVLAEGADCFVVKPCGAPRLIEILTSATLDRVRHDSPGHD